MIDVEWSQLKELIGTKVVSFKYVMSQGDYHVYSYDGFFSCRTIIPSGTADFTEFESSYKHLGNKPFFKKGIDGENLIVTDKGDGSFETLISHNYMDNTSWPATDNSTWVVKPADETKKIEISKAEIQFTHDLKFASAATPKEFYYDVWMYNPHWDSNSALGTTADNATYDVSAPDSLQNPRYFLYKRYIYKTLMDVFSMGNDHYTMPDVVDGLNGGVSTVRFDYDQLIVLDGSLGAEIRFCIEDDVPMEGTGTGKSFFTIAMVVRELDL